eukprot:1689803-Prymnesium_polylepis.1
MFVLFVVACCPCFIGASCGCLTLERRTRCGRWRLERCMGCCSRLQIAAVATGPNLLQWPLQRPPGCIRCLWVYWGARMRRCGGLRQT